MIKCDFPQSLKHRAHRDGAECLLVPINPYSAKGLGDRLYATLHKVPGKSATHFVYFWSCKNLPYTHLEATSYIPQHGQSLHIWTTSLSNTDCYKNKYTIQFLWMACISRFAMAILRGETELALGTIRVKRLRRRASAPAIWKQGACIRCVHTYTLMWKLTYNFVFHFQDLYQIKRCKKTGKKCVSDCAHVHGDDEECLEDDFVHVNEDGKEIIQYSKLSAIHLKLDSGAQWFKATQLSDIFEIFDKIGSTTTYMLVAGNTAQGEHFNFFQVFT